MFTSSSSDCEEMIVKKLDSQGQPVAD